MPSSDACLAARGVSFAYNHDRAVDDITLSIGPSDMLALAGPNGSGKSTLLRLMSGVLRPAGGTVSLDGKSLHAVRPRQIAKRIAVVSQHVDSGLLFSAGAIVAMGRTAHVGLLGTSRARDLAAIRDAMVATDTTSLEDRRFAELSGGEQQRVMLAMALAQETEYLLLDEPTVHLDLQHQHDLLELLVRLHADRSIGIVAVMHDLNVAGLFFERLAVMERGRLVADGRVDTVMRDDAALAVFRAPLVRVGHPQTGAAQVLLKRNA